MEAGMEEEDECVTPQCVAEGIRDSIELWKCDDGWNECGNDRNTGHLRPQYFKDVIGYQATHTAGKGGNHRNWAPLTECKKGFCAKQDFVVPHVGFTGRSYFLNASDLDCKS
eukprot:gene27970-8852_t